MYTGMAILRIKAAFKQDKGTYKCVARNIAGEDSTSANLIVQIVPGIDDTSYINPDAFRRLEPYRPDAATPDDQDDIYKKPYFIKVPKDTVVREGVPVRFDCLAFGRPNPTLTWYKNGIPINDDADHKVELSID